MLRVILNKSKRQHPTKLQLYSYLSHITKIIQLDETDMRDTAVEVLGITHLFLHNELVHLPYIAVATNTRAD